MRFLLVAVVAVTSANAFAAPLCPEPRRNLRSGDTNATAEVLHFSYRSGSFPLELYSAFAPQRKGPPSNYCLRYEAENKAASNIEMFNWPLAGVQLELLLPNSRISHVFTKRSHRVPSVEPTRLYAFTAEQIRSQAYRTDSQTVARESARDLPESLASSESASKNLPALESQFSGDFGDVTAISFAKWVGANEFSVSISIVLDNVQGIANVVAPFASAIGRSESIGGTVASGKINQDQAPLLMSNNQFHAVHRPRSSLFVIEHPITFKTRQGQVCFMAPAYSPVDVSNLNCNIVK